MATRTIKMKFSQATKSLHGMVLDDQSVKADATAICEINGQTLGQGILSVISRGGSRGRIVVELYNKDGVIAKKFSPENDAEMNIYLNLREPTAGETDVFANHLHYNVDAASFATGRLVVKIYGKINQWLTGGAYSQSLGYQQGMSDLPAGNGTYEIEVPFEVTEA